MRRIVSILAYIYLATMFSCANRIPPTGGPKDEDPPELISSVPHHHQLNFKETSVILVFNETVQDNNLKNELIISPSYKGTFDVKVHKNEMIITFDEPFDDSTTYLLNFRAGVTDVTEGNSPEDLQIAFSTWSYLDSLSIEGSITNLLTNLPEKGITVGAYPLSDTITPLKSRPLYFTKSNNTGKYALRNLRAEDYRIYAFLDVNKNLLFDPEEERNGFILQDIPLDTSFTNMDILVHDIDLSDLDIISARQNGQYYEIKSNKFITQYVLASLDSTRNLEGLVHMLIEQSRTIRIFNTPAIRDSLGLQITIQDSLSDIFTDTTYVKFIESSRPKDKFTMSTSVFVVPDERTFVADFKFNKPITSVTYDSIFIIWDTLVTIGFDSSQYLFTQSQTKLSLSQTLVDSIPLTASELKAIPKLYVGEAAFLTLESDSSAVGIKEIPFRYAVDFGIIKGSINLPFAHYFIQLLNKQHQVEREATDLKNYQFDYIPPGNYRIRVLVDENGDGEWYPGSLIERKIPEPVIFYLGENGSEIIALRSNWELVDMDINWVDGNVNNIDN